jgi:hypothetical protein
MAAAGSQAGPRRGTHKREIERLNLALEVKKAKVANVSASYASIVKGIPPPQLLSQQPSPQPQPQPQSRSTSNLERQTAFNNLFNLCKNHCLQMLKFRKRI